jgi:hypothetical protein
LKKLSLIAGGVASLALGTFLAARSSHAADHLDSATLLTNPLGDINDVYTWMTSDMSKLNLVMTVSPGDPGNRAFSDAVQYVFHVVSRTGTMASQVVAKPGTGTETKVICTFASDTSVQCWVVSGTTVKDYVTGDPSSAAGITSASGKVKVHAGRHSDPFFFNLQGFRNAIAAVKAQAAAITFNTQGCPNNLTDAQVGGIRTLLTTQQATDATAVPPCSATTPDCFAALNVKAIVVQVDKTLVNEGTNTLLAVWGSTHAKP